MLEAAAGAEPGAAEPASLAFSLHGSPIATYSATALSERVQPEPARVHEPYEEQPVAFVGLPFEAVLDAVYGAAWRGEEEILFTCTDGYQPTLPVARVLGHRAWLAFERPDRPDFSIDKFESGARRRVAVGPFYLVWDNLDDEVVRMDGDYGWPYQLVGIDLIRATDRFPKMVPPPPVSERVARGFTAYRMYCSRCHAMNGQGGRIGQDLNFPLNPTEYRDTAWIEAWIDDPTRVNPNTRMPGLSPALPARKQVIADIVAYLGAMPPTRSAPAPGPESSDGP